jgi:hypothetical protein
MAQYCGFEARVIRVKKNDAIHPLPDDGKPPQKVMPII